MIKFKRLSKKALSLLLALVLVATTFFIFDPSLLKLDTDAYANVETEQQATPLAAQTVYAPETIYLKPGTTQFQYFTNYDRNTGNVTSVKDGSGQLYFKNEDATEVTVAVNKLYKKGTSTNVAANALSLGTVNVAAYANISNGADSSIDSKFAAATPVASVNSGILTYNLTGNFTGHSDLTKDGVYFIEWVIRYKIDDIYHYTFAYTAIYSTPLQMAGISYWGKRKDDSNNGQHQGMALVTGAMAYGGGNARSAFTNPNFINVSNGIGSNTSFTNPLIAFSGFAGDNANSSYYNIPGGKDTSNRDGAYANTTLFPTQANGGWARADGKVYERNAHYKTTAWSEQGSYADPNPVAVDGKSSHLSSDTAGVAYLVVDTSRYTNYNQLPYLKVGWAQFDYHYHGDGNYVADVAVYDANGNNAIGGYSIPRNGGDYEDGDQKGRSFLRGLHAISGPIYNGMFTVKTQVHNGYSGLGTAGFDAHVYVPVHTTTTNKEVLRQQYQAAQGSISDYYNIITYAKATDYSSYFDMMKLAGEEICDPTAQDVVANPNITAHVKKYADAISASFGADLNFYVPEAIYTKPQGSYGSNATHYGGVYVNNVPVANDPKSYDPQTGDCKYGVVYFGYKYATDIKLSYTLSENDITNATSSITFSDSSTNSTNEQSISVGSGEYSYGKQGVNKYIISSAFQLNGSETGYWINWKLSYYDTMDGRTKSVSAYTYVYRTFFSPVSAAARVENTDGKDSYTGQFVWISGIHGITQKTSAGSGASLYYTKTTATNYNIPYAYQVNVPTGSAKAHTTSHSDGNLIAGKLYSYPFSSSDSSMYFTHHNSNAGVGDWFVNQKGAAAYYNLSYANAEYIEQSDNENNAHAFANSPYGNMIVDRSRYDNLNKVPGFSVGQYITDRNVDKINESSSYFSNFTPVLEAGRSNPTGKGTDNQDGHYAGNYQGTVLAGQSTRSGNNVSVGIQYNDKGNFALNQTYESAKTYAVKGAYYTHDSGCSDNDATWSFVVAYVNVTNYDKGALRSAVINAIRNNAKLDEKLFITSGTNSTQWTTYQTKFVEAYKALTQVDGTYGKTQAQMNTLANELNTAVNNLLAVDANGKWTSPARKTGTLTVKHVIYYPTQPSLGTRPLNIIKQADGTYTNVETKTYFYGDNIYAGYEETPGYNYFAFRRSEEGQAWEYANGSTPDLNLIQGDVAAQETYGTSGHHVEYYYTGSQNLTYTFVYTAAEAGLYLDLGDADNAFENAPNLVDLQRAYITSDFDLDGTTGGSATVMVNTGVKDAFSYVTNTQGTNVDTPAERMVNLFDFDYATTGWHDLSGGGKMWEIDASKGTMRITNTNSSSTDVSATHKQMYDVTPGNKYIVTYDYYKHSSTARIQNHIFVYNSTTAAAIKNGTKTTKNYDGFIGQDGKPFIKGGIYTDIPATKQSGTIICEFTMPAGFAGMGLKLGTNNAGSDVTFKNIQVYDVTTYAETCEKAEMNDIFIENAATGLVPGKTYTVSFTSPLTYDTRRWYYFDMYGESIAGASDISGYEDWSHDQGTIQLFMSSSGSGSDRVLTNYTVPAKVDTNISHGGTIATYTVPEGCSNINLGFCITNDDPLSGMIENIRIVEGDFVQYGKNKQTQSIEDGYGNVAEPTWLGYTFLGWSEGEGAFDGTLSSNMDTHTHSYTFGTDSDTILATWKANLYDVSFDNEFDFDKGWSSSGGTTTIDTDTNSITVVSNSSDCYTYSNPAFTFKNGHTYRVSYKYENLTNSSNVNMGAFLRYNNQHVYGGNIGNASSGTYSATFTNTSGADYSADFRFDIDTNGVTVKVYDIYIQDITRGTIADTTVSEPLNENNVVVHTLARPYRSQLGIADELNGKFPTMTSSYYDFDGWYTDASYTTAADINMTIPYTTTRFYSKWSVSVTYDTDGGVYRDASRAPKNRDDLTIGESETIANYVPYKVGYNFAGWEVTSGDSNNGKVYAPGTEFTFQTKVTLTAKWTEAPTADFNVNYTVSSLYPGQIYYYNFVVPRTTRISAYTYDGFAAGIHWGTPSSTAYTDSWITGSGGKYGVNYTAMGTGSYSQGTQFYFGIGHAATSNEPTGTTKFMIKEHYINYTFDPDGGTPVDGKTGYYNNTTTLDSPTRTGYTFGGWLNTSRNETYTNGLVTEEVNNAIISGNTASFVKDVQLVAQWDINSYNITAHAYYDLATGYSGRSAFYEPGTVGGTVQVTNGTAGATSTGVNRYQTNVTFTATHATGYQFSGWYTQVESDNTFNDTYRVSTSSEYVYPVDAFDYTLYAKFTINVYFWTVEAYCDSAATPGTYSKSNNGGTATVGTWDERNDDYNQNATHGQEITLWATPRPGYKFDGWYATAAGVTSGSPVIAAGQCTLENGTYKYSMIIDSNKTYIAKYTVQKLTLTINENTENPVNQGTYMGYADSSIELRNPTRTGHILLGWTLVGDPSGEANGSFTDNGNGTITYTFGGGNDRITANWAIADYNVDINPAGGTIGSISYQTANGKMAPSAHTINNVSDLISILAAYQTAVSIQQPTRLGYSFTGWTVTGNKGVFTVGDPAVYNVEADDGETVITATWEVNSHPMYIKAYGNTASLDTQYGDNKGGKVMFDGKALTTSDSETVNFGETRTITAVPDTGYSFKGWSTSLPNLVANSNVVSTQTTYTTPAMGDNEITYYALFVINSHTVTPLAAYNSPAAPDVFVQGETGGTVTGAEGGKINYSSNAVLVANAKTGYEFIGWYTSLNAEVATSSAATYSFSVTQDITLYAKFSIKKYNVAATMMANRVENDTLFLVSNICGEIDGTGDIYYGTSTTLTAVARPGFRFLGWYSNVSLEDSAFLGNNPSITISIDEPRVYNIWAKFEMLKFDVVLHAATVDSANNVAVNSTVGGKVGFDVDNLMNEDTDEYYTDARFRVYAQANVGYQFEGWYYDDTLTTQAVGIYAGLGEAVGDAFAQEFNKQGKIEHIYAKFKISTSILEVYAYSNTGEATDTYTVDNPGGRVEILENEYTSNITDRGAMITANITYSQSGEIAAIANTGYLFTGWYADPSFEGAPLGYTEVIDPDTQVCRYVATTPAMTEAKHQYYAKFDVGMLTIEFDSQGGILTNATAFVYYGTAFDELSSYTPTKTGFTFMGWDLSSSAAEGSYQYSIDVTTINGWYIANNGNPVTLYAVWSQMAYTINLRTAYYDSVLGYRFGDVGGTASVILGPGGVVNDDGKIMIPENAGVNQFIEMTPATGFKVEQWRYRNALGAAWPENPNINDWTQGLGETGMPANSIDVIVFFSLNDFDMEFYAYNNSAAGLDKFTNSATGGTVRVGENGVSGSRAQQHNVLFQNQVTAIAKANTGYTFGGWFNYSVPDENGIVLGTAFETPVSETVNFTVRATDNTSDATKFDNHFIAVFEINQYNATASVRTYVVGEDLVLTDPDTYDNGGNAINLGGNVGIGLTNVDEEMTWTQTVGGNENTITVYYREKVYYKAVANTGYYFAGWYGVRGAMYYGDNLVDEFNAEYTRSQPARDTYLEAKFFPETFTLRYDENGGTAGNPAEIQVTYNGEFNYNESSNPTWTGYNFLGWSDTIDGEVNSNYIGRIRGETIAFWFEHRDRDTGVYTIFAVWEVARVTVTLEKEGGDETSGDDDVQINQGDVLPEIEVPVYDGYVFGGYYTAQGGQGEQRYTAEGTSTYNWNTGDGKLYAYWKTPVLQDVEYSDGKWTYIYAADTGTYPLELSQSTPVTTRAEITANAPDDAKWVSSIETVDTSFIDAQFERAEDIDLNHYTQAALTDLLNAVKDTNTQDKLRALNQPTANQYVATMATSMELDYTTNRKSETTKPTVTLYENDEKLGMIKTETDIKNQGYLNVQYPIPNGDEAASYTFANKYSYTEDAAVDYYLYTNTANPVIAVEIGDGEVGYNTASYPTSATVTDNAAAFSYIKNAGNAYIESAVQATDDTSRAWFSAYTTAGIGTAHDYNAKTVIYLTPEFTSSGVQNEIVYTIKPSDDAYVVNEGIRNGGASLGGNAVSGFSSYGYQMAEDTEINICVCYHNAMNGTSDEGTSDGSGSYLQMYVDQVNQDVYLNQMHLFRVSGGASNWELPSASESTYPVDDATYPFATTGHVLGSFMYVFDSTTEAVATAQAEAGGFTDAKNTIIQRIKENAGTVKSAIMSRSNSGNINARDDGLGYAQIAGWSTNFYPKKGSYVYAHLVDRWGNVFNKVWKCNLVDPNASTISLDSAGSYNILESGGSNINYMTLDGANVTFNLDSNSAYENGVLTTTGNALSISTGEPNKTFNLTVVDNATNKTTSAVTTDSNGVIVLNVEDTELNVNEGAYSFALNGETVNLYAGEPSVVRDAKVVSSAIVNSNLTFTVKTSSDAIKVQVIEGAATWTFDINHPLINVVKNNDGTLTWTIPVRIGSAGNHVFSVRGKTGAGWEEVKFNNLMCSVTPENVASAVALQSVYNVEADAGERPIIKVRTLAGTEKLQFVYDDGRTITYSRTDDVVISTVDGVETWSLTVTPYNVAGTYKLSVVAKFEGQWQSFNTKTSTITVKAYEPTNEAIIHSVKGDSEVARGKYTYFTVLTSAATTKICFNFPTTTTTFTPTNSTVVENPDGTKVWTVKVRFWSKGEQDVNFSARTTAPGWTDGEVFGTITVK